MDADRLWHLDIDAAICDAHGICALCCPERITLDGWGFATVNADPITSPRTLARARRAVAACPEHALALRACAVDTIPRRERAGQALPR